LIQLYKIKGTRNQNYNTNSDDYEIDQRLQDLSCEMQNEQQFDTGDQWISWLLFLTFDGNELASVHETNQNGHQPIEWIQIV